MIELPDNNDERIDVLNIFVESVAELTDSWYVKQVTEDGINCEIDLSRHSDNASTVAPEQDALKAVLLTLRFFCQSKSERSSVGNVSEIIAEPDFAIEQRLIDEYEQTRTELNEYFKSSPPIKYPSHLNATTRWLVFDTILYGRLAHSNPKKRKIALQWENDPIWPMIKTDFRVIVMDFINHLTALSGTCQKIIDQHLQTEDAG